MRILPLNPGFQERRFPVAELGKLLRGIAISIRWPKYIPLKGACQTSLVVAMDP